MNKRLFFSFILLIIFFFFSFSSVNEELPLGDRFSISHLEREKILQQRKETMLSIARKRYVKCLLFVKLEEKII